MRASVPVAAMLAALWWSLRPAPAPSPTAVASPEARAPRATRPAPPPPLTPLAPPPEASEAAVDAYRRWARYPPDCRPLDPGMVDILEPDAPIPASVPLDTDVVATLRAARRHAVAGEELDLTLSVRHDGEPTPLRALGVSLRGHPDILTTSSRDEYRPGLAVALPGELPDGLAVLRARFEYRVGGRWRAGVAAIALPVQAEVPLRFSGRFSDASRDGHLVVEAGARIARAGRYVLHAVLRHPDDRPLAYATFDGWLAAGTRAVPFRFFGRLLRDAGDGGPYRLTLAWGGLYRPNAAPERVPVATWRGLHETANYAASDFGEAEWDAPEKRRRIRMLAALRRALR